MALYRSIGAALEADNSGTNPIDVRKDLTGLFIRAGVLPGGTAPLVTGTAGWAYNLGAAPWVTQTATGDGFHLWGNDGYVGVGTSGVGGTVPAAPGSGLSRIDILWVRHPSNGENGDTTSAPAAGVTCGTAASSPTAPALPAGAFELARNTMTSAATTTASTGNTITQTAPSTGLVGTDPPYLSLVAYSNGDYTTGATIATKTFTAETGKTYRVTAGLYGTQITSTGMPTVKLLDGGAEAFRMATGVSYAASTPVCGAPAVFFLVGGGASRTVSVTAQSTAGALRIAANGVNYLVVEQIA